jgi:hypothetical protein
VVVVVLCDSQTVIQIRTVVYNLHTLPVQLGNDKFNYEQKPSSSPFFIMLPYLFGLPYHFTLNKLTVDREALKTYKRALNIKEKKILKS